MSDLRAKVEALREAPDTDPQVRAWNRCIDQILTHLIPEGAVLVTEKTLAAALANETDDSQMLPPVWDLFDERGRDVFRQRAAAIIAKLREGT